jgi:hypothetical protein
MAGDIPAMLKIGQEGGLVEGLAASLILGPFSQFLGQPTVEGHFAIAEGQSQFVGHVTQAGQHGGDVHRLTGEQRFQGLARVRRFRMQRKGPPADMDAKLGL